MGFLDNILGAKENSDSVNKVKDPVCGMEIDRSTAAGSTQKDGQTYYFCSKNCQEKFSTEKSGNNSQQKTGGCCCG